MWLSKAFLVIIGLLQYWQTYWNVPGKWMFSMWFTTLFFWAPVFPQSVHLKRKLPSSVSSLTTYLSNTLRSLPAKVKIISLIWKSSLTIFWTRQSNLYDISSCALSTSWSSWVADHSFDTHIQAIILGVLTLCAPSCGTCLCPSWYTKGNRNPFHLVPSGSRASGARMDLVKSCLQSLDFENMTRYFF